MTSRSSGNPGSSKISRSSRTPSRVAVQEGVGAGVGVVEGVRSQEVVKSLGIGIDCRKQSDYWEG